MATAKELEPEPMPPPPSESGEKLPTEAIVGISVGVALVLVVIVVLVVWWCKRRSAASAAGATAADGGSARRGSALFKIQTLGRHYKLASIPNAFDSVGTTDEERGSPYTGRKISATSSKGGYSRQNSVDEVDGNVDARKLNGNPAANNTPNSPLIVPAVSTYLDDDADTVVTSTDVGHGYNDDSTLSLGSDDRSSHASHSQTMEEVERATRMQMLNGADTSKKVAPLAIAESMGSLAFASRMELTAETTASKLVESPSRKKLQAPSSRQPPPERPQSDAQVLDRVDSKKRPSQGAMGAFVPKLPPKKKRFFKSAAHVDPQAEQPLLPPDKRASTARSENCILITVAEDLDYDDLPDEPAAAPIVPPKLRPALPPKQTIDKSREDLAQIDLKFKSSLVDLRSRAGEEDYDDLPAEPDIPAIPAKKSRPKNGTTKDPVGAADSTREFEDYDDPISHEAIAAERSREYEDYDDPISHQEAAAAAAAQREFEDYDEPIHHSRA